MVRRAFSVRGLTGRVSGRGAPCSDNIVGKMLTSVISYAGRLVLSNGGIGLSSLTVFSMKVIDGGKTRSTTSFSLTGGIGKLGLHTHTANRLDGTRVGLSKRLGRSSLCAMNKGTPSNDNSSNNSKKDSNSRNRGPLK